MQEDPSVVLDLLDAFRRSKVMLVATSLGVFDLLEEGPAAGSAIAAKFGASESALERLLDACVCLNLLTKQESLYANTRAASTYLTRKSPKTMAGYVHYSEQALFPLWSNLATAVREGTHRWDQTFGGRGALFANFFYDEQSKRDFLAGMNGFGVQSSPAVVSVFDLSGFKRLVDLGGATGHLPIEACELYPQMTAAVFDLPEVVPVTREYFESSPARNRLEAIAGDFFTDALPSADLYALGRILHDWSEDKIHLLLGKIHAALPSGGGLLIAERLLQEDKLGPLPALLQSLNMLVCTEGRERSFNEYKTLLDAAGFDKVEARHTGKAVDAILATKTKG